MMHCTALYDSNILYIVHTLWTPQLKNRSICCSVQLHQLVQADALSLTYNIALKWCLQAAPGCWCKLKVALALIDWY